MIFWYLSVTILPVLYFVNMGNLKLTNFEFMTIHDTQYLLFPTNTFLSEK